MDPRAVSRQSVRARMVGPGIRSPRSIKFDAKIGAFDIAANEPGSRRHFDILRTISPNAEAPDFLSIHQIRTLSNELSSLPVVGGAVEQRAYRLRLTVAAKCRDTDEFNSNF
jgi:hypothetical protein